MNVIDIAVLLFLLLGAIVGFKKGFIKSLVSFVGTILVIVISFKLKNPIANFMFKYCPFFDFAGIFAGLKVLNVLMYEAIAFLLVFVFLSSILGILINISGIVEKILNATIVLGFFSKILGALAGVLEMLAFVFVVLFALVQFNVTSPMVIESKVGSKILNKTPLLTNICAPMVASIEEIYDLQKTYEKNGNVREYNASALVILVKNRVITKEQARDIINSGKLGYKDIVIQ